MLKLVKIDKDNILNATKIENEIFPEYNAYNNYLGSLNIDSKTSFFIIYLDDEAIGVTGLYRYSNDYDNVWIGFFGLLKEYRNMHLGKESLILTEEYAKKQNFKFIRLFTDKYDNQNAIDFYKHNGYIFEDYDSDLELLKDEFKVVIGSKSLCNKEVDLWNNKFINLSKQTLKQR